MALVRAVYRATEPFPNTELFGLTSQLRRAAVSIPSNIAEGQGRLTTGEFKQFLGHSRGSLLELETQILIAADLGYLSSETVADLLQRVAETADTRRSDCVASESQTEIQCLMIGVQRVEPPMNGLCN